MPKPLFSNHKTMRDIPTTAAVPYVCPLSYACGCQDWRVHAGTHSANRLDLGGGASTHWNVVLIIFVCGEEK